MPIQKNKISYLLDLEKKLEKIPRSKRSAAKNAVGEFILSKIDELTQREISPVTGEKFEPLSPEYKDAKKAQGKGTKANLVLNDIMLSSTHFVNKQNGIEIKIVDGLEKKKAHNHNLGVTLPKRPFIPDDTKATGKFAKFDKELVMSGVDKILKEFEDGN